MIAGRLQRCVRVLVSPAQYHHAHCGRGRADETRGNSAGSGVTPAGAWEPTGPCDAVGTYRNAIRQGAAAFDVAARAMRDHVEQRAGPQPFPIPSATFDDRSDLP